VTKKISKLNYEADRNLKNKVVNINRLKQARSFWNPEQNETQWRKCLRNREKKEVKMKKMS